MKTAERCAGCGGPANPRVSDAVPWCGRGNCSDHGPADPGVAGARPAAGRLVLPPIPDHHDPAGQLAWLTAVFALDPDHRIVRAGRFGRGPDALIRLDRAGAQAIRFEPFKLVSSPVKLYETLGGWTGPTDGPTPLLKREHCGQVSYVVRMACGLTDAITDEEETAGLVGHFVGAAQVVEGFTTYGTAGERYEALQRLQPDVTGFVKQYLRDANTGELVIRVGDLADVARKYLGASLPHGWLDGRMAGLGWTRKALGAYSEPGRDGRRSGRHLRCDVYRGVLAIDESDGPAVNT